MSALTWQRIAAIGLGTGLLSWLVARFSIDSGLSPTPIPWTVALVCVAAAGMALYMAWAVREYQRGRRPGLDPLRAARTAVYSQACAYAGALMVGGFGGYALAIADQWAHAPRREVAISALIAGAGAGALLVAGWVAEHWCRTDRDADDRGGQAESTT